MNRLVLCSHGTRSPVGAARVTALMEAVAQALPTVEVRETHVDVHPPFLVDVVVPGAVVVPLLLAPGHHVETDIGRAAARVGARVTPALGPDHLLTSLLLERLHSLGLADGDLVVLAAAGSSVAGSELATREVAHRLSVRLEREVHVGYGAASSPRLDDLVDSLRSPGRRIVAASYLLAPGHFHDRVLASGADEATDPLLDSDVPDRRLVELVVRRYLDAQPARPTPPGHRLVRDPLLPRISVTR